MVWARRLGWTMLGVLGLWALAWLAVPPLLKWQAELRLGELLGRSVQIGEVEFRPWTLELTIRRLSIAAAPGASDATPLLQLARLHVDAEISSLLRLAPVVNALQLDGLKLRLARTAEGHYDIDDLIERLRQRPASDPDAAALRFALYNLELRDAEMAFDDRPVGRMHRVEAMTLGLPFISNLPAQVDITVEPRLAFTLGATRFDSGASTTPFAQTRAGELRLAFKDFDLLPYIGYLPAGLPLRLQRGRASARLQLNFALPERATPLVTLKGALALNDLAVVDTAGKGLLGWKALTLELRELRPLTRQLALGALQIDGAELDLVRDSGGRLALQALLAPPAPRRVGPAEPGRATEGDAAVRAASAPMAIGPAAWRISLDSLHFADARVQWRDATTRPQAALALSDINLEASALQWPVTQASPLALSATLRAAQPSAFAPGEVHAANASPAARGAGATPAMPEANAQDPARPALGSFRLDGRASDREAQLALQVDGLDLDALAPYVGQLLRPRLAGTLQAIARVDWSDATDTPRRTITLDSARIDALQLIDAGQRPLKLRQLALADAQIDLLGHRATLGSVKLVQPELALARAGDGQWNAQHWAALGSPPSAVSSASAEAAPTPAASAAEAASWQLRLKALSIDGGQIKVVDAAPVPGHAGAAVQLQADALRLRLGELVWPVDTRSPPIALQLSARLADPAAVRDPSAGVVDWKGRVGLQPLLADGALRIERLPVHLFEPYFGSTLKVELVRAEASYQGRLALRSRVDGMQANASGDALIGALVLNTRLGGAGLARGDELLSWQALQLKGISFASQPGARPALDLRELSLSDFYARLVVTEQGRLQLQDATAAPAATGAASAPGNATEPTAAPAGAASTAIAATAYAALPLDISVGVTRLVNGRVDFSDHFVRPNFSAELTALHGQLGAFRSDSPAMAALELRGRAAGTALLEVRGNLNPATRPPALDIQAKVSDLELAPLSPYSGKYAGYAIERGKLSVDLAYRITPEGKLDAKNQVILNQLTFGDRIESPDATKLPVLLAVSLLKDRHGVIDINLPVSGSLQDPQFSVAGIIWKIIVNLLGKALTAPFALLSGGEGTDLSVVEFVPGTARIAPAAQASVDKVAQALIDRPALTMTVTGSADPQAEEPAYRRATLEARLLAEARRELLRSGAVPASAAPASVPALSPASASAPSATPAPPSPAEHARLLKSVYQQTPLPNKPRNAIGVVVDIPEPQMQALLEAAIVVNSDVMRELALQRGLAVRDALVARGLDSARLFLAAPKIAAAGEADAGWTPRAQLALAVHR